MLDHSFYPAQRSVGLTLTRMRSNQWHFAQAVGVYVGSGHHRQEEAWALGYIYIRELPDGQPHGLTNQTDHFKFCPSFSRDGRYVVYSTWKDDKLRSIRIASADVRDAENWRVARQPGH